MTVKFSNSMTNEENRNKLIDLACIYDGNRNLVKQAIIHGIGSPHKCWHKNCITIYDDEYPIELFDRDTPSPFVLFFKGDISLLKEKDKIMVIGSSQASKDAKKATEDFVKANKNKVIITGTNKGIEEIALKNAEKPILVLSCGLDCCYPEDKRELYEQVERKGLIISEFPWRTRSNEERKSLSVELQATLSSECVVMEIKKRDLILINALNVAKSINRNISVLPLLKESAINGELLVSGMKPL